jgi:hypothetical protein
MDFYNRKPVPEYNDTGQLRKEHTGNTVWIYTDVDGANGLRKDSVLIVKDTVLNHFHVSTLNGSFLSPKTRLSATKEMHLLLARP